MEVIYTDSLGIEQGVWNHSYKLDIEISKDKKDFEMVISNDKSNILDYDTRIYVENTEFGGVVREKISNSMTHEVKVIGETWRGMLEKKIIEPPNGEDYRIIKGELNQVLKNLIEPEFEGLFKVDDEDTGIMINYKLPRYCSILSGIVALLKSVGCRIDIKYICPENCPGFVKIKAENIKNYSEEKEYSQDGKVNFISREKKNGCNHLICLGKGELKARLVVHLYVWPDGSIRNEQYYKGILEKTEKYETNEENRAELERSGRERLKELADFTKLEMFIKDVELEIGDIVAGRDRVTGLFVSKPIEGKVLEATNKSYEIEYKLKEDD